jgi:hypothetical protein
MQVSYHVSSKRRAGGGKVKVTSSVIKFALLAVLSGEVLALGL